MVSWCWMYLREEPSSLEEGYVRKQVHGATLTHIHTWNPQSAFLILGLPKTFSKPQNIIPLSFPVNVAKTLLYNV